RMNTAAPRPTPSPKEMRLRKASRTDASTHASPPRPVSVLPGLRGESLPRGEKASLARRARCVPPCSKPASFRGSFATGEEAGEEVEEVLGVGLLVAVEVGVAGEEGGEEVEEVLAVEAVGVVPVAGACGPDAALDELDVVPEDGAGGGHGAEAQRE